MGPMGRWSERLVVGLLLALMFGLTVAGSWNHSATYDEPAHLGAGVARVALNDHRFVPEHPPLAQDLAALAALPRIPPDKLDLRAHPDYPRVDPYAYGRRLLFEGTRADGDAALRRARAAIALLAALGGLLTWWTARTLFGRGAGLGALAVLALDPGWLAHGGLVTTDAAAASAFLATVVAAAFAFAPATTLASARARTRCAAIARSIAFALAAAALALSKLSAPLVLPVVGVLALAAIVQGARGGRAQASATRVAASLALAGAVTFAAIWAAYGFRASAVADPDREEPFFMTAVQLGGTEKAFEEMVAPAGEKPSLAAATLRTLWRHRVLPQAYVFGLAEARWTLRGRASFLCGELYDGGRVAYFPVAFATKTPLGLLLLLALGAAARWRAWRARRAGTIAPAPPAAPAPSGAPAPARTLLWIGGASFAVLYAAVSLGSFVNLGHRHLLPLLPWCAVAAGAAWSVPTSGRIAQTLRWAALAWLALENGCAVPNYLGYFHELVGGASGGRRLLVDSNVDWGQDLARLAAWQERAGVGEIELSRFGSAPPASYGVRARELPSRQPFGGLPADPWTPGVYAIAATQFESLTLRAGRRSNWDARAQQGYAQLLGRDFAQLSPREQSLLREMSFGRLLLELHDRKRAPDETVGTSILIFRLDDEEITDLKRASLKPLSAPVSGR